MKGVIYLLETEKGFKIGVTENPQKRIKNYEKDIKKVLWISNPQENIYKHEKDILIQVKRIGNSEYFKNLPDLFIENLKAKYGESSDIMQLVKYNKKKDIAFNIEMELGIKIKKNKTGFFNVADIERFGNAHRLENGLQIQKATDYFRRPATKEFLKELEKEYGEIQTGGRGRGKEKWVHPFIFIDLALWYSPELKVKVYQWIYDNLTVMRDNSGESYKRMTEAVFNNCDLKGRAGVVIPQIARFIYNVVGVSGSEKWETATEEQLKLRDEIQTAITTASYFTSDINEILSKVSEKVFAM